jgi:hypothetical protein
MSRILCIEPYGLTNNNRDPMTPNFVVPDNFVDLWYTFVAVWERFPRFCRTYPSFVNKTQTSFFPDIQNSSSADAFSSV